MHIQFFPSGTFPVPDGEKQHVEASTGLGFGRTLVPSVVADVEFKKRTADIPCAKISEASVNDKRPYSDFPTEVPNKRAKQEHAISISSEKNSSEEPSWKIAASTLDFNDEIFLATDGDYLRRTGFDPLEDDQFPLSEHSHQRCVPIGSDHQADLPDWIPVKFKTFCSQSSFQDTHSTQNIGASSSDTAIDCDCADEGSVACVRQHVREARENLRRLLGPEKFTELGLSDMGEDVAGRWTEMEEDLFHMVVLSNSATLGRNFWTVLPHVFPSLRFQELVSYYFNVFMLRKRADQNRFDPYNVDSDNDDWQENGNDEEEEEEEEEEEGEEGEEGEEEEEDSAAESHAERNRPTPGTEVSEELDFQDEADDDEDEFYCDKSSPLTQPVEGNSTDCSLDQDAQGDSCTSFERMYNNAEREHENSHAEHRKYEYFDGDCDMKPWEINYFQGAADKGFDFFPTCNVLEEVFGKGSWDKGASDGSDFS